MARNPSKNGIHIPIHVFGMLEVHLNGMKFRVVIVEFGDALIIM